jgi:Gpi18-like mannosyltransferase
MLPSEPLTRKQIAFSCFLVLFLWYLGWGYVSIDIGLFLENWYGFLQRNGLASYGKDFANYAPFYTYLLGIPAFLFPALAGLSGVKLVSAEITLFGAWAFYKLMRVYMSDARALRAALILLLLPTIHLNAIWLGQVDMLYTLFLLLAVLSFVKDRPFVGMVCCGLAFAAKAQAIFLAPLVFILMLKKKIPWHYALVVPMVYVIMALPALLAGRNIMDLLFIYQGQFDTFKSLSRNAASLYSFVPNIYYDLVLFPALALAACLLGFFSLLVAKKMPHIGAREILLLAAIISLAVPFLLPKMHERYFFQADVLMLALAVVTPSLWYAPVMMQVASYLSYVPFLAHVLGAPFVQLAAYLNLITLVKLLIYWKRNYWR